MPHGALVAAAFCALILGACANPFEVFAPSEAEVVRDGWYAPAPRPELAARHCYRTLARADCYSAPLSEAALRRVGWFDAPVGE